jgi:hypothetical protein
LECKKKEKLNIHDFQLKVGESITAMDSLNFEDGGTVWAVGCSNGKIFLRQIY